MSLLVLFSDQITASTAAGMPAVKALLETTTGHFVDITSDLVSVTIERGRQQELDRFVAGTAIIELKNATRKYDPQNTAGPYYGNLKPMRLLRLTATWNGVTYPLFQGYIDGFKQKYVQRRYSSVTITATDAFKVLARAALPTSPYAREVLADNPAVWYRLSEASDATTLHDYFWGRDLTVQGSIESAAGLIATDPDTAITLSAANEGGLSARGLHTAGTQVTAEILFRSSGAGSGETLIGEVNDPITAGWVLVADPGGGGSFAQFSILTSAGASPPISEAVHRVDDGQVHHIVGTWDGTTMRLYLDGALAASQAWGGTMFATDEQTYMVVGGAANGPIVNNGAIGTFDEAAVYTTALSDARVLAHAEAVTDSWAGDLPGERAARILDAIGFSSSLRDLDAGTTVLQAADLGQSPLEHLQKVSESELGGLYVTAAGNVRLAARTALVNQTSQGTFSDSPSVDGPIRFLEPDYSEDFIRNDVTVARAGGVSQNAKDDASISEFQTQAYSLTGLFNDDDDFSRDVAQFIVTEYAQPFSRITELTLTPRRAPTVLYPQVLARELLDVVTVTHTPQATGPAITQVSVIEHVRHQYSPDQWETKWRLTPAYAGRFLQLDNPNTTIEGANAARLFI